EKLRILQDIAYGIEKIHNKQIVHQDLHSGNLLVYSNTQRNYVKVAYFGISKPLNSESNMKGIFGVIPYIAPEIFIGEKYTKASDIYSFGMVMWEVTSGKRPFADCEHDSSLILNILEEDRPIIVDGTPQFLRKLMESCWDANPAKRPTATKIVKVL
ncbi:kinase-like domain-containing protein, partial [Gigaspora rosea]